MSFKNYIVPYTPISLQLLYFWTLSYLLYKIHGDSEIGFRPRIEVEGTQLGPIDKTVLISRHFL
jgi:hypothetical protein